eukprot:gb/GECG01001878.1/.p1 GENE.gb/GECG01001878.1/~~gb/GECG01001878.1/.p1  ORF type:complete len:341 (+),score=47.37 gb/GECG01001878.1/:1-1023(+)
MVDAVDMERPTLLLRDRQSGEKLHKVQLTSYDPATKRGEFRIVPSRSRSLSDDDHGPGSQLSSNGSVLDLDEIERKPVHIQEESHLRPFSPEIAEPPVGIGMSIPVSQDLDIIVGPVRRNREAIQWKTVAEKIHRRDYVDEEQEAIVEPQSKDDDFSSEGEIHSKVALNGAIKDRRRSDRKRKRPEDNDDYSPLTVDPVHPSVGNGTPSRRPQSPSSVSSSGVSDSHSASSNRSSVRGGRGAGKMHSQYKGVGRVSSKCNAQTGGPQWRARMSFGDQRVHIGCYCSEKTAAKAYDAALVKYKGENPVNFPHDAPDLSLLSESSKKQNKIHTLKKKLKNKK